MSRVRRSLRGADRLLEQAIEALDGLERLREPEQELRATLATVRALIEEIVDRPRRLAVMEGGSPRRLSLEVGESTVGASVRNAYRLVLAVHDGVRGSLGCSPDLPSRKLEDYLEGMDRLADALEGMGAARARVRGSSVRDPGVERPLDRFVTP